MNWGKIPCFWIKLHDVCSISLYIGFIIDYITVNWLGLLHLQPPVSVIEYSFSGQNHITMTLDGAHMEERRGMWSSSLLCLALKGWKSKLGLKPSGRPLDHTLFYDLQLLSTYRVLIQRRTHNQPDESSKNRGCWWFLPIQKPSHCWGVGSSLGRQAQDPPPPKEPWESPLERKARRHREKARQGWLLGPGLEPAGECWGNLGGQRW